MERAKRSIFRHSWIQVLSIVAKILSFCLPYSQAALATGVNNMSNPAPGLYSTNLVHPGEKPGPEQGIWLFSTIL
jgi:hypothetical protein